MSQSSGDVTIVFATFLPELQKSILRRVVIATVGRSRVSSSKLHDNYCYPIVFQLVWSKGRWFQLSVNIIIGFTRTATSTLKTNLMETIVLKHCVADLQIKKFKSSPPFYWTSLFITFQKSIIYCLSGFFSLGNAVPTPNHKEDCTK